MFIYLGLDLIGMSEEYLPLKVEIATIYGNEIGQYQVGILSSKVGIYISMGRTKSRNYYV